MEVECKSTRFCLICNYVTRIIDPLKSRCVKFRFKSLDRAVGVDRLANIAADEGVLVADGTLARLIELADGDLRRAITMLQSAAFLSPMGGVNRAQVEEMAGIVPSGDIDRLVAVVRGNDFSEVQQSVRALLAQGRAAAQVLMQLSEGVMATQVSDAVKARIHTRIALCDEQLTSGSDEYLQIIGLASFMMKQFAQA